MRGIIVVRGMQTRAARGLDPVVALTRTLLIAGLTVGLAAGAPAATLSAWEDPPPAPQRSTP